MSQKARKWAEDNFSLDVMVQQYDMIISKVVSQRKKHDKDV